VTPKLKAQFDYMDGVHEPENFNGEERRAYQEAYDLLESDFSRAPGTGSSQDSLPVIAALPEPF